MKISTNYKDTVRNRIVHTGDIYSAGVRLFCVKERMNKGFYLLDEHNYGDCIDTQLNLFYGLNDMLAKNNTTFSYLGNIYDDETLSNLYLNLQEYTSTK